MLWLLGDDIDMLSQLDIMQECDRQTDRQTYTRLCTAPHSKN